MSNRLQQTSASICTMTALAFACVPLVSLGCKTAPKAESRATFALEAQAAQQWFDTNVTGVGAQIKGAAGYIVFPDVGQFGIIFGGGTFGRGAVYDKTGTQVGWAAINRASIGLQLGVQGFKMLMVLKDDKTFTDFKEGAWRGDVAATAVAANSGAAASAQFKEGVAVYVGDQAGLMAGMSIALAHVRYKNLNDVE
jgi:lipid-binding SYLF domain-containing protein